MVRKNTKRYSKGIKVELPYIQIEVDNGQSIEITPYDFTNKQISFIIKEMEAFKTYRIKHKGKEA